MKEKKASGEAKKRPGRNSATGHHREEGGINNKQQEARKAKTAIRARSQLHTQEAKGGLSNYFKISGVSFELRFRFFYPTSWALGYREGRTAAVKRHLLVLNETI